MTFQGGVIRRARVQQFLNTGSFSETLRKLIGLGKEYWLSEDHKAGGCAGRSMIECLEVKHMRPMLVNSTVRWFRHRESRYTEPWGKVGGDTASISQARHQPGGSLEREVQAASVRRCAT